MPIKTSINEIKTITRSRMLNYSARYFLNPSAMILITHSNTNIHVKNRFSYFRNSCSRNGGFGYLSVAKEREFEMMQITMKFSK